ncbi:beta-galactosidase [Microbacterium ginsengiterrae]|uniref:Beta-galactosidase n=1 Tax=Microbacterium ginsengiterrae TaxID=546115 RepID=A0A7W9CD74_9MICO|nr:beta-galactosidase [Microbacterium ginsengiterrae]MBB5743415.1 beta-galactosidase [Microbacterium ginsengiterrae]
MSSTTTARAAFDALISERGLAFGGDYNPEQWPRETWLEDVRLMREAGVNFVTVGVFSWAMIEPRPGAREWGWLDEILELLHDNGIAVDLATPVASPPPWLGLQHPEVLPVDADGVRLIAGSRNQFSPASRVYREHALAITRDLAARYAGHPAVRMWHVGNEYGQIDHGDEAAREFRHWLRERHGDIDTLNAAWNTAFWSQRYDSFDEILPPRRMPYLVNPAQSLDFRRYSSDQLRACYRELRDAIRAAGAQQPITTNFMGFFAHVDYHSWAGDVDVISDDQYPDPADPHAPSDIALVQDLMRSLGRGRSWMLMEQSISAVSWREHNLPKSPRRARRDSLQAVARGADAICFFQWRQARSGAERFHSSMLPHAGADSDVFRGACRQGADLRRLAAVAGSTVRTDVAMLFDWSSWWAGEEPARPTHRLSTMEQMNRWYRSLWRRGIPVDVLHPDADLDGYRVILVPHAYILSDAAAAALAAAVERGAQVVVGPFSGVADDNAGILQGRSPVQLRTLIGASGEEWSGILPGSLRLAGDLAAADDPQPTASILAERLRVEGGEVIATHDGGELDGIPAIVRSTGTWYLGTVVSDGTLDAVLAGALAAAHVTGPIPGVEVLPDGLEAVRRGDVLFLLNHTHHPIDVPVRPGLIDLLTGEETEDVVGIAPGDVRALSERHDR